jgi:ribonuclease HI
VETEDGFHAVVQCTKARALRSRLREYWDLPKEELFSKTGDDWLLILLNNTKKEMHQRILLTLWRSWHLRNDIVHAKGKATIDQSVRFLISYTETLNASTNFSLGTQGNTVSENQAEYKGKNQVTDMGQNSWGKTGEHTTSSSLCRWNPPPIGWLKTNVDGSFVPETGAAAVGAVIRDHNGETLVAAGKVLKHCRNAEDAEATALAVGAKLAANWTRSNMIFESDSKSIVSEINSKEGSMSSCRSTLHDFISFANSQQTWECVFARRAQNSAAHEVAALVRKSGVDHVWNSNFPETVTKALAFDCNRDPVIMK